jgi:hypothetical protein
MAYTLVGKFTAKGEGKSENMAIEDLEQRIASLEREVYQLKLQLRNSGIPKNWESTVGMFANDPTFDEIVRLGREYRDQQNREMD